MAGGVCPGRSCLLSDFFGPISETVGGVVAMFLSAVTFAKSKSKTILVKMLSQAGTGYSFNTKRSRLREKLTLLHYDPIVLPRLASLVTTHRLPVPNLMKAVTFPVSAISVNGVLHLDEGISIADDASIMGDQ
uniref:Large ribosomal subunit protein bL33m n=1 Tax=Felis catus TaxID=9685 RepID=A0ABI7X1H1_FELCA